MQQTRRSEYRRRVLLFNIYSYNTIDHRSRIVDPKP